MNTNPISFKGIYHYPMNTKEEFEKYKKILIARQKEDKLGIKIVLQHQNFDAINFSFEEFKNNADDVPSVNWLIQHAKYEGIQLPKYLNDGSLDVFVLDGKDKEDYEKALEQRELFSKSKHIINKAAKKAGKDLSEDETSADFFLRIIKAFDEIEQKAFDKFLKKRKIEPMDIKLGEHNDIYFQDKRKQI